MQKKRFSQFPVQLIGVWYNLQHFMAFVTDFVSKHKVLLVLFCIERFNSVSFCARDEGAKRVYKTATKNHNKL